MTECAIPFVNPRICAFLRKEKRGYYSFKLLDFNGLETYQLTNRTGYEIMQKCDGKRTVKAIVREMCEKYANADIDGQRIKKDVEQSLAQLSSRGVIEWCLPKWRPCTAYVEKLSSGMVSICDEMSVAEVAKFMKLKHCCDMVFLCAANGFSTTPISNGIQIAESKNSLIAYLDENEVVQGLINIVVSSEDPVCGLLSNVSLNDVGEKILPELVRQSFSIAKKVLRLTNVELKMGRVWVEGSGIKSRLDWHSVIAQAGFKMECVLKNETCFGDVYSYVLQLD